MKHHEEKIKNLSVDQMSAYLYSLSNTLSVKNNQKDFTYVLKHYVAKIQSAQSSVSPSPWSNASVVGFNKDAELQKFYQTLLHLDKKEVLLYDNDFKDNYYHPNNFYPGGLCADLYSIYTQQVAQKNRQRSGGAIDAELYLKIITQLHSMADETKPKDVKWDIATLYQADQSANRVIDPVFEKMIELHGLSIINNRDTRGSWPRSANEPCIEEIIGYKAAPYLHHLRQIANSENKSDSLNRWVKEALVKSKFEHNDYAKALGAEIEIQKEQRQVKGLMSNFNKKNIKKTQKEKKTLASLSSLFEKNSEDNAIFDNSPGLAQATSPSAVKTKKYKL